MTETSPFLTSPIDIRLAPDQTVSSHFTHERVQLTPAQVSQLSSICPTDVDWTAVADASRDWWPLSMHWALEGSVPMVASALCRPNTTQQIAAVLALCSAHGIPVTAAGGRSGVCGASIPLFGGVVLDTTAMRGVVDVDPISKIVEVLPGTFGPELERDLAARGLTVGHFPQSFAISTVGGWVACRGAGQFSTRYGKIEDMVCGLEVVLASGEILTTTRAPRSASGPDLAHLFIGSEGTLGIISRIWLRCHSLPTDEQRCAYMFADFASGIDACRRILQRGAHPAVLRLYDAAESRRNHSGDGTQCVLLVMDQGDAASVNAHMAVVHEECLATTSCRPTDSTLVDHWMDHRNDTSALQALTTKGYVVDTMEIAAPWSQLALIHARVLAALSGIDHARSASCHLSHSYDDGACLYFTFAASPPPELIESTYVALWNAATAASLDSGANLSHHHGIGLNRARFVASALGTSHGVLQALKDTLDPDGILNPGKMGLSSPFTAAHLGRETPSPWPR